MGSGRHVMKIPTGSGVEQEQGRTTAESKQLDPRQGGYTVSGPGGVTSDPNYPGAFVVGFYSNVYDSSANHPKYKGAGGEEIIFGDINPQNYPFNAVNFAEISGTNITVSQNSDYAARNAVEVNDNGVQQTVGYTFNTPPTISVTSQLSAPPVQTSATPTSSSTPVHSNASSSVRAPTPFIVSVAAGLTLWHAMDGATSGAISQAVRNTAIKLTGNGSKGYGR